MLEPLDGATLERIRRLAERELTPEEFGAAAAVPLTPEERATTLELVDWFRRRSPTPGERLAHVRRAHSHWTVAAR